MTTEVAPHELLRLKSHGGRLALATTVLGSGIALLDGTIVNVALPTIGRDLDADLAGLQWVVNAYALTLAAFILLGGSLGDRFGRRAMYAVGVAGFGVASALCALSPSVEVLVAARAVQGLCAALLVPGSLAILQASFHRDDRMAAYRFEVPTPPTPTPSPTPTPTPSPTPATGPRGCGSCTVVGSDSAPAPRSGATTERGGWTGLLPHVTDHIGTHTTAS